MQKKPGRAPAPASQRVAVTVRGRTTTMMHLRIPLRIVQLMELRASEENLTVTEWVRQTIMSRLRRRPKPMPF